jgi:hypothetical protein|tara:strand:- start:1622 stop:1909 length:288 start_codon:yes stop_codon:yes gene_type:complete
MSTGEQAGYVGNGCSYANLQNYNIVPQNMGYMNTPPIPKSTTQNLYIVPNFSAIGYDALTHGLKTPTCSGFYNITDAYGKGANNCNAQYIKQSCQ